MHARRMDRSGQIFVVRHEPSRALFRFVPQLHPLRRGGADPSAARSWRQPRLVGRHRHRPGEDERGHLRGFARPWGVARAARLGHLRRHRRCGRRLHPRRAPRRRRGRRHVARRARGIGVGAPRPRRRRDRAGSGRLLERKGAPVSEGVAPCRRPARPPDAPSAPVPDAPQGRSRRAAGADLGAAGAGPAGYGAAGAPVLRGDAHLQRSGPRPGRRAGSGRDRQHARPHDDRLGAQGSPAAAPAGPAGDGSLPRARSSTGSKDAATTSPGMRRTKLCA